MWAVLQVGLEKVTKNKGLAVLARELHEGACLPVGLQFVPCQFPLWRALRWVIWAWNQFFSALAGDVTRFHFLQ